MIEGSTVKILLVDDLPENLVSLSALLRRDDLTLITARSGPEALEILLKEEIALALLDVQMPGMDGFELAELMRGNERTGKVPIIFLTAGDSDRRRRFRGYEAGAVDFIQKPIESDILLSKVSVFFELARQRQQLAAQRDRLQSMLDENLRLLDDSRKYASALKLADMRKDEFLATLAHELRNPLAPIRNGLQILRMSNPSAQHADIQDMMDRQVSHLVRLIDDLLDVSRVSQGKIELRRQDLSLAEVIGAAAETSRPLIDARGHEFTTVLPDENLWLNADATRLSQVISNLLNNAAKYTPDGGRIELRAERDGAAVVISIADNGIGIEPAMLDKVFELFTQIDTGAARTQDGLGIGLALVRRLVEMHDGTIGAESKGTGQGSRFSVTLPLVPPPASDAAGDAGTGENAIEPQRKLKILVVDDNQPSAQTIAWMLELIGHDAVIGHDGIDALRLAREENPDAILLDIGLPGMNGYEVAKSLRAEPEFSRTLLIAQTGWGQEKDRQLAREAGFDHHLVKPVKIEDLKQILGSEER